MQHPSDIPKDHAVLFYDADCMMCSGFAEWILKQDAKRQLYLAPLLGETSGAFFKAGAFPYNPQQRLDSVLFIKAGEAQAYQEMTAIVHLLDFLQTRPALHAFLNAIPVPLDSVLYKLAAKIRLLTKTKPKASCVLMQPEFRDRLLS